jgi:redox-sensitive bicupin YhaK (pirin superfamily)
MNGEFIHQDSHKGGGLISEGGVQYMTAGSGILHIETPPEKLVMSGGLFHGVQLWINLPKVKKLIRPRYQNIEKTDIKLYTNKNSDSVIRLLSGKYFNQKGVGETQTNLAIMHISVSPGGVVDLPWPKNYNTLVYVLAGLGESNDTNLTEGELLVKGKGDTVYLKNTSKTNLEILLLGGEPIGEKVVAYGPFVMNEEDEIKEALEEYSKGKLGVIPPDAIMPYHLKP